MHLYFNRIMGGFMELYIMAATFSYTRRYGLYGGGIQPIAKDFFCPLRCTKTPSKVCNIYFAGKFEISPSLANNLLFKSFYYTLFKEPRRGYHIHDGQTNEQTYGRTISSLHSGYMRGLTS